MPTNLELALAAERMYREGWAYVLGTFGNRITDSLIDYKCKQYATNQRHRALIEGMKGRIAVDCYGIVKALVMGNMDGQGRYKRELDRNEQGAFDAAKSKGTLGTLPRQVGVMLWRRGHTGVIVDVSAEDPQDWVMIDAYGTPVGLRRLRIRDWPQWTHWYRDTYIDYSVPYTPPVKPDSEPGGGGGVGDGVHEYHATYVASESIQGYAEPLWQGGERPIMSKGQLFSINARLNRGEDYFARDQATGYWYRIHDAERWYVKDAAEPAPKPRTHATRAGDTYWRLAQQYLGDGSRWAEIAAANPGIDAYNIRPGMTLVIPAK